MEWQAVVLVMQILMLAVGWFLFQQARGELTAQASQTPVLGEVRALQRSIKQLLEELNEMSDQASGQLEHRCEEARRLLASLDRRLEQLEDQRQHAPLPERTLVAAPQQVAIYQRECTDFHREYATIASSGISSATQPVGSDRRNGRQQIYALADQGQATDVIAKATGLSVGEIETLLALRTTRAT
jgi:DNA-binding transcriptional MerR regulator